MGMQSNELQASRYELKFLIGEATAVSVRNFVRAYLDPDPFMSAVGPKGYVVESLYMDTPNQACYRQTKDGVRNRYKLRIRTYEDGAASPAFLEVKKRTADTIHKARAAIAQSAVTDLLSGRAGSPIELIDSTSEKRRSLELFRRKMAEIGARPSAFVRYVREAYVPRAGNVARVTFDRGLTGADYSGTFERPDGDWRPAMGRGQVVMELKFTERFPVWMRELTHTFGLRRSPFPKYVHCVDALKVNLVK